MTEDRRLDALVADYVERRITRRIFMKRAVALGVMASSAGAILAACGSSTPAVDAHSHGGRHGRSHERRDGRSHERRDGRPHSRSHCGAHRGRWREDRRYLHRRL